MVLLVTVDPLVELDAPVDPVDAWFDEEDAPLEVAVEGGATDDPPAAVVVELCAVVLDDVLAELVSLVCPSPVESCTSSPLQAVNPTILGTHQTNRRYTDILQNTDTLPTPGSHVSRYWTVPRRTHTRRLLGEKSYPTSGEGASVGARAFDGADRDRVVRVLRLATTHSGARSATRRPERRRSTLVYPAKNTSHGWQRRAFLTSRLRLPRVIGLARRLLSQRRTRRTSENLCPTLAYLVVP